MKNIAILEDNDIIRDVLAEYFEAQPDFNVIFTAENFENLRAQWHNHVIDVLICDISLPGKSGIEATLYIKENYPKTHVIMFTIFEDSEKIFQALCAGASGYILKNTPLDEVKKGIYDVFDGGGTISPKISLKIIDFFQKGSIKKSKDLANKLTIRETEILSYIQSGYSNKMIGEKLFISVDTIKFHNKNIFLKLQVNSRAELISKYKNPVL